MVSAWNDLVLEADCCRDWAHWISFLPVGKSLSRTVRAGIEKTDFGRHTNHGRRARSKSHTKFVNRVGD